MKRLIAIAGVLVVLGTGFHLVLTAPSGALNIPNLSGDPNDAIGKSTITHFVRPLREGVMEHGKNQSSTLPYTSYQRITANGGRDLFAYIKIQAPASDAVLDHDLKFPVTARRGVGLLKLAFLDGKQFVADPAKGPSWSRGQFLAEGPGHCAECHSPRSPAGAITMSMRFAAAPDPEGHRYMPNITHDENGIGYRPQPEIAGYLGTGVMPIGPAVGGSMVPTIANLAHLSVADETAMAVYLKSIREIDAPNSGGPEANCTRVVRMLPHTGTLEGSPEGALAASPGSLAEASVLFTVAIKQVKARQKTETFIAHHFQWNATEGRADILLPATAAYEPTALGQIGDYALSHILAMKKVIDPVLEAHNDNDIFASIAERFGRGDEFTRGAGEMDPIRALQEAARIDARGKGMEMPVFDLFWKTDDALAFPLTEAGQGYSQHKERRDDPLLNPLGTSPEPIAILSYDIAKMKCDDCPPHPNWIDPVERHGGSATKFKLHIDTNHPEFRLQWRQ